LLDATSVGSPQWKVGEEVICMLLHISWGLDDLRQAMHKRNLAVMLNSSNDLSNAVEVYYADYNWQKRRVNEYEFYFSLHVSSS
jgi:hypothetical protein